MKSIYYREQKHICGKSYATAPYMEVDLYPVTPKQHKASRRAKRKEASTLAQQTYNDNRAKRYHVQLVNANFGKGDFSWTGTYDDDHHPEPGATAKADPDLTNYIKRLYRWCDKNGVQRPKWVAATEYCTVQEDGTTCGRHHHHAIIQHTDGLTRDVLEQLWADKAGQIGFTRCEYLDVDHGSVESLVRYISKNKRCARSWRQSRGLEKPKTPPPNDTKWSRKKLDEASTLYIDDVAYWERKYPGKQCRVAAHHRDYAPGGVLARHTGAQGYAENEQVRKGHGSMLCVKKVIVICREVNSQTGQIAVYVVPMEIDEHTVVRLSLRSMFNQELRYFFAYEDVYQEQKQEITAMLKRRNITKQEVDSVYGIAEIGRQ